MSEDIIAMARAAMRDERLSDGALYGKLADEVERLRDMLSKISEHPDVPMLIRQYAAGKLHGPYEQSAPR